jgi:tetratricopeptide (TPR) repeat protein
MRVLALALAAVLLLPASAVAQREFIRAYKDGEEAYRKGNDALAEQKFNEARSHSRAPKQSRKANLSGNFFEPFVPDLYLGLIYARTGRHREAQEFLERAIRDELVTPGQRAEYALATSSLERAREQIRLASTVKPPPPPVETRPPVNTTPATTTTTPATTTATNTTPPNVTPTPPPVRPPVVNTPPAEPTWMAPFRRSIEASRTALRQGHYSEARGSLAAAASAAGDAASRQQAEALRREIDQGMAQEAQRIVGRAQAAIARKDVSGALAEVANLETLSPGHATVADLRGRIDTLQGTLQGQAALAQIEKTGVRLFLSGNYNESAAQLKKAVDAGTASPRIYLFLASSRAAEALLAPPDRRDALAAEARSAYARAKGAASSDERFISPSILRLLKSS